MVIADGDERAPDAAVDQVPADDEQHERDREREVVKPLVGVELDSHVGEKRWRIGLDDDDALHAAGPPLEQMRFQDRRHRDREREGGERQVEAREAQGRQADDEADDAGGDAGQRDRPDVAPVLVHDQRRRRVPADRHQRPVAERDLPRVAGEQVEPDDRDEEGARLGEVARVEVADEVRQEEEHGQPRRDHGDPEAHSQSPAHQTRLAETFPKRPAGRTSRTPRITASATGRRRSVPIQPT